MTLDPFGQQGQTARDPARTLEAIDISADDHVLAIASKAIRCGGAGNLVVVPADHDDEDAVTITGVLAGEYVPVQAKIVIKTGTTCTNMTAFGP